MPRKIVVSVFAKYRVEGANEFSTPEEIELDSFPDLIKLLEKFQSRANRSEIFDLRLYGKNGEILLEEILILALSEPSNLAAIFTETEDAEERALTMDDVKFEIADKLDKGEILIRNDFQNILEEFHFSRSSVSELFGALKQINLVEFLVGDLHLTKIAIVNGVKIVKIKEKSKVYFVAFSESLNARKGVSSRIINWIK